MQSGASMTLFAPATSPRVWSDGRDLFAEFPKAGDHPSILRFPLTEAGLSKLLKLIPNVALTPGYVTGNANIATKALGPKIKIAQRTATARARPKISDKGKSALRALVRGVKY